MKAHNALVRDALVSSIECIESIVKQVESGEWPEWDELAAMTAGWRRHFIDDAEGARVLKASRLYEAMESAISHAEAALRTHQQEPQQ